MENAEYKNKKIEFEESSDPKISIEGNPVRVNYDADAKEFNAAELPYRSFKSVRELGEAIVEQQLQNE